MLDETICRKRMTADATMKLAMTSAAYGCDTCVEVAAGFALGSQRAENRGLIEAWEAPFLEAGLTRHVAGPLIVGFTARYQRVLYTGYSDSGFGHTIEPTANILQATAFAGLSFGRGRWFEHGPRLGLSVVGFFGESNNNANGLVSPQELSSSERVGFPIVEIRYNVVFGLSKNWGIVGGVGAWMGYDTFRFEEFVSAGIRWSLQ
ncbi:MAG: hypothetical protein ACXVEF_38635 [Polyangiales bacterium]